MKNKLLPLLFVLGAYGAYGQVGIGTPTPNLSSQLEIVASDKGILIPRVAQAESWKLAPTELEQEQSLRFLQHLVLEFSL